MSVVVHPDVAETLSTPCGDGLRRLVLSERWSTSFGRPNGGYVLAAMIRGVQAEVGATPLVVSASFLRAPEPGPAELRTTLLRRGRRVATATAELVQGGVVTTHLTATFRTGPGESRPGPGDLSTMAPPALPDPADCVDLRDAGGPVGGIFDRVEHRLPPGPSVMLRRPSGLLEAAAWQRPAGGRPVDHADLAMLVDTLSPVVMEIGARASLTVQLTVHLHALPTSSWIATSVSTGHVRSGVHEEDCLLHDADGTLLAQSRQLAVVR